MQCWHQRECVVCGVMVNSSNWMWSPSFQMTQQSKVVREKQGDWLCFSTEDGGAWDTSLFGSSSAARTLNWYPLAWGHTISQGHFFTSPSWLYCTSQPAANGDVVCEVLHAAVSRLQTQHPSGPADLWRLQLRRKIRDRKILCRKNLAAAQGTGPNPSAKSWVQISLGFLQHFQQHSAHFTVGQDGAGGSRPPTHIINCVLPVQQGQRRWETHHCGVTGLCGGCLCAEVTWSASDIPKDLLWVWGGIGHLLYSLVDMQHLGQGQEEDAVEAIGGSTRIRMHQAAPSETKSSSYSVGERHFTLASTSSTAIMLTHA